MSTYYLKCFNGNVFFDATIRSERNGRKVVFVLETDRIYFTAEDHFPFLALQKIRLYLEDHGVKLLCNGARIDVYPSGFFMESFKAYRLVIDKAAAKEDLVNILDATDELERIGTVSDQEAYWKKWLNRSKER